MNYCNDCIHFVWDSYRGPDVGACHRYPPVCLVRLDPSGNPEPTYIDTAFPIVGKFESCGEFKGIQEPCK